MSDKLVVVNLPDKAHAPGYRDSLTSLSDFRVVDFGESVAIEPREGAGTVRRWFAAHRLCDSSTELSAETWRPIQDNPPSHHVQSARDTLMKYADELSQSGADDVPRQLRALRARLFVLGDDLPEFLGGQMPILFEGIPNATLWYVSTDEVLLARFAFLRSQLALRLTPDIPTDRNEFEGLRLLEAHSITHGSDFANAFEPMSVMFSSAATALVMPAPPHAFVLTFGEGLDLREDVEQNLSNLYRPIALDRAKHWEDEEFWTGLGPSEIDATVPWWTDRMNVLFSHAADPTRFADKFGHHDPQSQAAWHLTFERALADTCSLLANPSQAGLVNGQMAFDLLDKCESLLGYSQSGPGFKQFLRKSRTMPRLKKCWLNMPIEFRDRFRKHTHRAFEDMYETIRGGTLKHRLTRRGVLVARGEPENLKPISMDEFVSAQLRALRNSAHGLSRILRGDSGHLVATFEGNLPPQLPQVAALIFFGLVADAERMISGEWWE